MEGETGINFLGTVVTIIVERKENSFDILLSLGVPQSFDRQIKRA